MRHRVEDPSDLIESAVDGLSSPAAAAARRATRPRCRPTGRCKRTVIMPPAADCTFTIEVMVLGAFGAKACHAATFLPREPATRSRDAEHQHGLQRKHPQLEFRRDAEAAATAALAGPIDIHLDVALA